MTASDKTASLWLETARRTPRPPLTDNREVDVAVVGGGVVGMIAATLLRAQGARVAVIERSEVGTGVTGHSTAKITSGHTLKYHHLERSYGEAAARIYAESQEAGLAKIVELIESHAIDCDFSREDNLVYTESIDESDAIKEEVEAAQRAGLRASFVTETTLPYPIAGAFKLTDQAQFHPQKFLAALAETLGPDELYENTVVTGVKENGTCKIDTPLGSVTAHDVIVATHLPILDRGLYFAKAHPHRSYVVAAPMPASKAPRGMFITSDQPTRSIRVAPLDGGDQVLLLVGGEGHKTGEETDTAQRYRTLERWASERFGVTQFLYRWSTQDNFPVDKLAYIGKVSRGSEHLFTATGFAGWGFTNGAMAAMLLTDLIQGRSNAWQSLYDSNRLNVSQSAKEFVKENAQVGVRWIGDRVSHPQSGDLEDIQPGEGAVVAMNGKRVAAHRTEEGELRAVSAICTHLACIVRWNGAERSWDCPCHGSRFDTEGKVLQGPAIKDLQRVDLNKT